MNKIKRCVPKSSQYLSWPKKLASVECIYTISIIISLLLSFIIFYTYLNLLYMIDESYDISGPKEYNINEKITLRVKSSHNINQLKSFVQHYTLCRVIDEIQIEWTIQNNNKNNINIPTNEIFIFAHTHSKVNYDIKIIQKSNKMKSVSSENLNIYNPSLPINTEGVLLLDEDVFVTCDDLGDLLFIIHHYIYNIFNIYIYLLYIIHILKYLIYIYFKYLIIIQISIKI